MVDERWRSPSSASPSARTRKLRALSPLPRRARCTAYTDALAAPVMRARGSTASQAVPPVQSGQSSNIRYVSPALIFSISPFLPSPQDIVNETMGRYRGPLDRPAHYPSLRLRHHLAVFALLHVGILPECFRSLRLTVRRRHLPLFDRPRDIQVIVRHTPCQINIELCFAMKECDCHGETK